MVYKTDDGREFYNKDEAQKHADELETKRVLNDWNTYNKLGMECYNSGKYEDAVKHYNTSLEKGVLMGDWNMATVLANRAAAYLALGDQDAAEINWTAAADIYFSLFDDDTFGGPALDKYQQIQDTFEKIDYKSYIARTPPKSAKEVDANVYRHKGMSIIWIDENKDYEKAIEYLTQAIKSFPDHTNYSYRGLAYGYKKDYEAALADYNEALRLLGDNDSEEMGRICNLRGDTYLELGNKEAAIADYKKAADLRDENTRRFPLQSLEKLGVQYTPKPFKPSKKSSSSSSVPSYSSSSESTSSGRGGVFMSLVFAVVCGFCISGMVTDSLNTIGIITLAVAAVAGFIAWRFKKTILKLALIGLIILSFVLPRVNPSLLPKNWGLDMTANTVTVTADALNMRTEPSGSAEIIMSIENGTVLTVTGEAENGWLPVEHDGSKGWVSSQYVE